MSNGNGSVAPTCPISSSQPTTDRLNGRLGRVQPSGPTITTIPAAHDLRTAINAINIMNSVIQHVTRGTPQVNNVYPPTEAGIPDPANEKPPPPPQYERITWREANRDYVQQQVINPEDPDQFVEIKTLSFVHWIEDATGHNLVYQGK